MQVLPPSGGRGGVGGGAQEGKEGAQQAEDSSPAVQVWWILHEGQILCFHAHQVEVGNARPVRQLKVPVHLQYGGGFPNPQLHQQEVLALNSDNDEEENNDDNDDEEKIKNSQKNLQNTKSHKKTKKAHKNLGSMLRTAAPKKIYKIPINPPKKNKKVKTQKKCCNDEVMISEHEKKTNKIQKIQVTLRRNVSITSQPILNPIPTWIYSQQMQMDFKEKRWVSNTK